MDVGGDRAEVVAVAAFGKVNGDNPFEAVAGGTPEEQLGLEVFVALELTEESLNVLQVVEVEAKQAAVLDELVFLADGKGAGKGTVIELRCFELAGTSDVAYPPEVLGAVAGIAADDVVVGVADGDLLVRDGVGHRRLEEGEVGLLDEGRLEKKAGGLLLAEVEVELVADDLQEFITGFLVEAFGEVQEGAVGDVSGGIVVPGDAARQLGLGVDLLHPDVQRRAGVVPRVAVPAAVVAGDFHQEVGRVVLAEDVGVNVGAVERAGDDVFFGQVGGFHRLTLVSTRMVVGYEALGHFLNVVFVGRSAFFVPSDDGGALEEEALAALDKGNEVVRYPAVDGLDGGLFGKEGGEFLNGHLEVRVEVAGLEGFERIPDVADEEVGLGEGCRDFFFGYRLEIDQFFFELLFEGFCGLGGREG